MKIIAIIASPHGMQGNTGRLLKEVLSGVEESDAEIEILNLKSLNVQPCVGCDVCHKTGICPIKDDYESIKEKLLACDGYILASPNYIFNVTAQMKALFDRCNGLLRCQALEHKYSALVETSGGGGDDAVIKYMTHFVNCTGAWSVGGVGSLISGIRTFPDEGRLYNKARKLGRDLFQAIAEKQTFPEQTEAISAFGSRMSGLVEAMKDYWVFERDYWAQKESR